MNTPGGFGDPGTAGGESFAELTRLASFEGLKAKEPAGVKKQSITFRWEAVMVPPEPKPEGETKTEGNK